MSRLAALAAFAVLAVAPGAAQASFTQDVGSPLQVGTDPYDVATGDFDGNGRPDIAAANGSAGTMSILLRGQAGGFTSEGAAYEAGPGASDVVAADFDGDGRLDLAVAAYTSPNGGRVFLRKADNTGFVQEGGALPVPDVTRVAAGDLNADGRPDLVFGSITEGKLYVLLRAADNKGFQAPVTLTSAGVKTDVGITDFTADGQPDIVASSSGAQHLELWVQKDDGGFAQAPDSPWALGGSGYGIAIADYDANGRPDVAVAAYSTDLIHLMLGQPGGGFVREATYPGGDGPIGLETADFDFNGTPDVAAANQAGTTVTVLLRTAGGFVPDPSSPIGTGQFATGLDSADFDGDGRVDLAVANIVKSTISVLLNTTPFPPPPPPPNLDVDADGVQQPVDCRDDDPSIRPGARDVPGDGIDQDCAGGDADFPLLQRQIAHQLAVYPAGYATFTKLSISPVRAGDRIGLRCRGKGCPFKRSTVKVKRDKRSLSLVGKFKQAKLRKATVTVVVTRPGTLGRRRSFTFKPGKTPRFQSRCVRPGVAKPVACPA